ncbi:MAG: shikimate dehydrogenase family protein [Frankia sp.]
MRAAVLGSPIAHSLSPALHRAAYAALGRNWSYTAIECDEAGLPAMLARVRAEPGWAGLSLTMPLKIAAVGLLDEVDELAGILGAVNTVVVRVESGGTRLVGFNTDVDGIAYAVDEVLAAPRTSGAGARAGDLGGAGGDPGDLGGAGAGDPGGAGAGDSGSAFDSAPPAQAVVLGAGGTARAAIAALARRKIPAVDVIARRPAAGAPLVALGAVLKTAVTVRPWGPDPDWIRGLVGQCDLVVATTPAGATDALASRSWPAGCALVDLLYHPWPTRLAAAAAAAGVPVAGGLTVLAAQAVRQVRLFTGGGEVGVDVLRAAGEAALADRA